MVYQPASREISTSKRFDNAVLLNAKVALDERKRAEPSVQQEKDFNQAVADSLPGLFYLINEQGQLVRWNEIFRDVSGCSAEELTGKSVLDFFKEPDKSLVAERMQQVFSKGEAVVEASFVAKDQTETPCLFSGKRLVFDGKLCLVTNRGTGPGGDTLSVISYRLRRQVARLRVGQGPQELIVGTIPDAVLRRAGFRLPAAHRRRAH